MADQDRRPVISGVGVVTTAGSGADPAWSALEALAPAGRDFSPDDQPNTLHAAALPDDYRAHPGIPRNLVHFLDRGSAIALDAALRAVEDAALEGSVDSRRIAVVDGLAYRAPGQATLYVPYGQLIARATGARNAVLEVGGNEASGLAAVSVAATLVRDGVADIAIAGAAQALQRPIVEHLQQQGWLATGDAYPYDQRHLGMTPGEAAAYVVIEAESIATGRGAKPVAAISAAPLLFDGTAEPLMTSDATEAGHLIQEALTAAGYVQNQVDTVFSCADGRHTTDFSDGLGIMRTFGRHANFASVTAVAGALGSCLAASGPLSLAMAVEAIRRQRVPGIAAFQEGERDLELNYARECRDERIDCALVTSLGLGGTNAAVLLQRIAN